VTGARRLAAALLALAVTLAAVPAAAQPPIWIVRRGASTVILFGSIHLLPTGLDWRPPALTAALAKADELVFELPIDLATDAQAVRLSRRRGVFKPSDRLAAHLTAEQQARLDRVATFLSASPAALDRMRPWLAEISLSLLADAKEGAVASQGVEEQIQGLAPSTARRRAFETVEQQIGFLAGAPATDQIASLDETLHEIEERPDVYRRMVAEWMSGDLAGLQTEALDPLQRVSPALYRRLITDRSRRWAGALRLRLDRPGTVVVIVGVGHLIGPAGVPALLRAKGLEVEGP